MKKKIPLLILILILMLSLCGCRNQTHPTVSAPIYQGESDSVSIEIYLSNNQLTHIELLSQDTPLSDRKEISYVIEDILLHGEKNKTSYPVKLQSVYRAVENALAKADLTYSDLNFYDAPQKEKVTHDYNLVIIGAGGAGLTAAIEAARIGITKIVVLEKMSYAGGNTRMSNGCYAAPGNFNQPKSIREQDSPTVFYNDLLHSSDTPGNPALVSILTKHALEDAVWLKEYCNVSFLDELMWYEGHSFMRSLRIEHEGAGFIDALMKKALALGIEFHYTTTATSLLLDETQKVSCVKATNGNKTHTYNSRYGVILATGGFGANKEMLLTYGAHDYFSKNEIITTNSPASTGDGMILAANIGAALTDMSYIQFYPVNNPATGNFYHLDYARLNDNAILINQKGQRFVNEHETRNVLSDAILQQPGTIVYELIDSATLSRTKLKEQYDEEIQTCKDQGVLFEGTLSECAVFFGIPYENLLETVNHYNFMAKNGGDTDFYRTPIRVLESGEYLMFAAKVSLHSTMGGIVIDENARVVTTDGSVLKGLYAAGEVTGGIHGSNRLGSAALLDATVFGRIAAQTVAKDNQ